MKNNKKIILALGLSVFCLFNFQLFGAETKTVLENYNEGLRYQQDENFYLAQQYYLEVVGQNPAYSNAWFKLAECSYKLGEFDLALNYLSNAEKYEPSNSKYLNLKGMIYLALGRLDEGRNIFNEILKKFPNDIDAHFGLAEIELYEGRYTGAEKQYNEALKRQSDNRNALLALSLINAEKSKYPESEKYLRQALTYYSGDPEVHYLAAVVYSMKGDYKQAENHARISVEINGNLEKSYELLTTILYKQGRYSEVLDLSDFLIGRNRKNSTAWYLKGIAYTKTGKTKEAIDAWTTGLNAQPQDELMRFAMELEVRELLSLENNKRKQFAQYHVDNARQYKTRYDGSGAIYEYQRALLLDPVNYESRAAYADILKLNGMNELYLEQLKFIKDHNYQSLSQAKKTDLDDKIEAYDSLLEDTLAKRWKVDPFYLDKTRWNIAVFYEDTTSSFIHADTNKLAARACADVFSGIAITSVKTQVNPITSVGEAFKNARSNAFDYFIIVSLSEGQNDLTLTATMYNARTGLMINSNNYYSTGNNRFSTVLRRFRKQVLEQLTVRGKIIKRNGKTVVVDLGKAENIVKGTEFKIIRRGGIQTSDNGTGVYYTENDVYGTLVITNAGEEISEGEISNQGFYDRINIGDEVVLVALPDKTKKDVSENAIDNVPRADENGKAVVKSEIKAQDFVNDIKRIVERPSVLELLRNIY